MGTQAIDIQNLPDLKTIEELIDAKRQEIAELRKVRSLARFREECEQAKAKQKNQEQVMAEGEG